MYTHKNRNKDTLQIVLELLSFISSPSFPPPPHFWMATYTAVEGMKRIQLGREKGREKRKSGKESGMKGGGEDKAAKF